MFHSAALKLTGWYLALIMLISICFSIALYHVSSQDLGRNVNRQVGYFDGLLGPNDSQRYDRLRHTQLSTDLGHLKGSLVIFNILVLIGGGAASYLLARRTLNPIEEALDAQARFASDASHELRTPLAAIQAENEVALRNSSITKSQVIAVLRSNLEEVGKLKALSEGLLRLAAGNGGVINAVPVCVNKVSSRAVMRHDKLAQDKKIKIADNTGSQQVLGDEDSLVELLSILIDNAVKYSQAGGSVKLSSSQRNKNVYIKISDSGEGIAHKDLPHIFDRFYRTDDSRSRDSGGGYGLGLAIAKNITEAHDGYIEVSSAPGKGSIFSIVLPAA